jgi:hypothetical protein
MIQDKKHLTGINKEEIYLSMRCLGKNLACLHSPGKSKVVQEDLR